MCISQLGSGLFVPFFGWGYPISGLYLYHGFCLASPCLLTGQVPHALYKHIGKPVIDIYDPGLPSPPPSPPMVPPPCGLGWWYGSSGPPPCGLWWWYGSSGPPPVACGGGMLVCWYVGMLVCWYVGMYVGMLVSMYVCMYVCR